jgi:hypothetical protein
MKAYDLNTMQITSIKRFIATLQHDKSTQQAKNDSR